MARNSHPLVYLSQYLAARLAAMGLTMVSADASMAAASAVGRTMYSLDQRHRLRAQRNIERSFPHLSSSQIDQLTRSSFEHFLQLALEVCHTPRLLHLDTWTHRVKLTNMGPAIHLLNSGRPAILITGHLGNWEVLGYLLAVLGYKVHALARPLDNPHINRWLLGIREKRGLSIITKWDATDRMLDIIASNGLLAFIADQNAGDRGMFVPFFGKLASTYKSIGLLAQSQNIPIICGYARRLTTDSHGRPRIGCYYELGCVDIITPDDWASQPDPLYYITARYMRAIESMVRLAPEQYLWMHRRWKSRPRFEREKKEVPPALRRNLEALPWMTPQDLTTILQPMSPEDLRL